MIKGKEGDIYCDKDTRKFWEYEDGKWLDLELLYDEEEYGPLTPASLILFYNARRRTTKRQRTTPR